MRSRSTLLVVLGSLLVAGSAFAGNDAAELQALQQTVAAANRFAGGAGAFSLTANLTLFKMHKGDERGSYKLVWLSEKDWRRDVIAPSFESSEGTVQGMGWAKHSIGSVDTMWLPLRLSELEDLRNAFAEIGSMKAADKVIVKRSRQNTCWKLELKERIPIDACANNDSHAIESLGYKNAVYELKGSSESGGRKFPQSVSVIVNGMKIVELANIHAESIATPAAELTAPPAGVWKEPSLACALGQGKIVKRVAPDYPALARENNEYGVVIVGVLVGTDGAVKNTVVLQTAGPRLDQAALDVVKKWQFEPFQCGGQAVEAQSDVSIQFNPQHTDLSKGSLPLYH